MDVNPIAYSFLLIFTLYTWFIEHRDIHCPDIYSSKEECQKGGAMCFSYTRPEEGDTKKILIEKIYKASGAERHSIKWRRSVLLSIFIAVAWWLLIGKMCKCDLPFYGLLPDWKVFYLSVLISYAILLGNFMYYSTHVFGIADNWIKDCLNILKEGKERH